MAEHWPPQGRILALDLARGLAVLGMMAAHMLHPEGFDWGDSGSWLAIVNGRSATLFAMLAGVSIGIISGGGTVVGEPELDRARIRIAVRAGLIFVIGAVLVLMQTPVAIILQYYALLFLLMLPVLRWSATKLFAAAFLAALLGPVLAAMLRASVWSGQLLDIEPVQWLATGSYPALIWAAYFLAGLGIARAALSRRARQLRLLAGAVLTCAIGYAVGAISAGWLPGDSAASDQEGWWFFFRQPQQFLGAEPHSGTFFEVLGNGGFAAALIAVLLMLGPTLRMPVIRTIVFPVLATGAMALTAYTAHIVAFFGYDAATGRGLEFEHPALAFWVLAGCIMLGCTLWALLLGRGPLERLLTSLSNRAARPYEAPRLVEGKVD